MTYKGTIGPEDEEIELKGTVQVGTTSTYFPCIIDEIYYFFSQEIYAQYHSLHPEIDPKSLIKRESNALGARNKVGIAESRNWGCVS